MTTSPTVSAPIARTADMTAPDRGLPSYTADAAAHEQLARAQAKHTSQWRRARFALTALSVIAMITTSFALRQTRLLAGSNLALAALRFVRDQDLPMATLLALEARQLNQIQGERVLEDEIPFQIPYIQSKSLAGHHASVLSVAWHPDGRQLASASWDNTVIIWDAASNKPVRTLTGHSRVANGVAWRPDGRQLASASGDNTVIIWDAASGKPVRALQGHNDDNKDYFDGVTNVAWHPDGRQLAAASWDNTVIIWDAKSGEARAHSRVTTMVSQVWHGAPMGSS
ncbi:MAG: WD40 repeat domain-containing protein [Caldilineaceae bacterium]